MVIKNEINLFSINLGIPSKVTYYEGILFYKINLIGLFVRLYDEDKMRRNPFIEVVLLAL
ncbi:hypothetical protein BWK59_10345 [Flavobacterium davisii]|uniref:Uncharacterized protein n=1 Tax=Flavobacterium davisii TaxID=2906077 RepID=A0A246GH44_9FLAO|nr:hypothetical protein BWK59_10345 [Flavobacterium davisii]